MIDSCEKIERVPIIGAQRSKTSRTGSEPLSSPGSAPEDSLGLGSPSLFILFSGDGGVVIESIASAGNGNSVSVMQKTIQDRISRGHIAKEFAPFLQWTVARHDCRPVFIPAHHHFERTLTAGDRKK
jgi:hypothetical protein